MTKQRANHVLCTLHEAATSLCGVLTLIIGVIVGSGLAVTAAGAQEYKTAGGLTVYLGVLPAELIKGPPPHSGAHQGPHEYHLVAAVYDSGSNTRIADATVTARVSGIGLSGPQKTLEQMKIADTITYGGFFNLTPDLYTIRLTIQRPGSQPVILDFKYDHRRQ